MSNIKTLLFFCLSFCINSFCINSIGIPPKLTIIIVVDQCAFYYLQKLQKYCKYGIKRIRKYGTVFQNAYFPHGKPETAVGHAGLNTGTYARFHGFVGNNWFDQKQRKFVNCDFDDSDDLFIFGEPESKGKSSRFLAVDGISDCFIARSNVTEQYNVFSLSLKSRSAIAMAGHIKEPFGGVFWFQNGKYTTSNAFCNHIPAWVTKHNNDKQVNLIKEIYWKPFYNIQGKEYAIANQSSYLFTQETQFFNKTKKMNSPVHKNDPYFWYQASPQAMYDLFDLAKSCIRNNAAKENTYTLLWISMSGLDKLGHLFGPDSYETVDYMYHFDYALENFLTFVKKEIGKRNFICIFTADHGTSSIPEISQLRGLPVKRVSVIDLKKNINMHVVYSS